MEVAGDLRIGPPLASPSAVVCIGMNYAAHAAESGEIPSGDYQIRVSAVIGAINYVVYDWSVADPKPDIETVISVLSRSLIGAMQS